MKAQGGKKLHGAATLEDVCRAAGDVLPKTLKGSVVRAKVAALSLYFVYPS